MRSKTDTGTETRTGSIVRKVKHTKKKMLTMNLNFDRKVVNARLVVVTVNVYPLRLRMGLT